MGAGPVVPPVVPAPPIILDVRYVVTCEAESRRSPFVMVIPGCANGRQMSPFWIVIPVRVWVVPGVAVLAFLGIQ
jgi:hypothetical protein